MLRMVSILLTLLMVSGATAGITVSTTYYSAEATANSSLYASDYDFQEGLSPVNALSQVSGTLGSSTAWASGDLLQVGSLASVAVLPAVGAVSAATAAGTGINALVGLVSDSTWTLDLAVSSSVNTSTGGEGSWMALALLTDGSGAVYSFTSPSDGDTGGGVFGPGSYTLILASASSASASAAGDGTYEFAEVSSSLAATVGIVAVPAPGAFALVGMGVLLVDRLRRRSGRF